MCASDCHQCVFTGRTPAAVWLIRIEPPDTCFKARLKPQQPIVMQREGLLENSRADKYSRRCERALLKIRFDPIKGRKVTWRRCCGNPRHVASTDRAACNVVTERSMCHYSLLGGTNVLTLRRVDKITGTPEKPESHNEPNSQFQRFGLV